MTTDYTRNSPTVRTYSPQTVYDNNLLKFEENNEEREDFSGRSVTPVSDRFSDQSALEIFFDDVTDSKEIKSTTLEEERSTTCLSLSHHNVAMKKSSHDQFADQTKSKLVSANGTDDAFKTTQMIHNKDVDKDLLTNGWTLQEDDLSWLPLAFNKSRFREYKEHAVDRHLASFESHQTGSGRNMNLLRLLGKRIEKGASRLRYLSGLTTVADMYKKCGFDLPTMLEFSEVYGGPIPLPCKQCCKNNCWKGAAPMTFPSNKKGSSDNHKCLTCGGQVQTVASFGRMIRQMRDVIENKCLVPYDVLADGNCLFAAVNDQLRIHGDFSFTTDSLRRSAVNYLKENPTADDGTPLEMFLTDGETWRTYIRRMSEDGEWGDHMTLRALANVINMKIIIYGGTSGDRETILCPNAPTDENELSEKNDQALDDSSVIYLGHESESHYLSLRPKHWRQDLMKGLHNGRMSSNLTHTEDRMPKCLVQDINFILRQVFRIYLTKNSANVSVPSRIETAHFVSEMFGSQICKLVPCKLNIDSFGPDISMFFPSVKEEIKIGSCFQHSDNTIFNTPYDTEIVTAMASAKAKDLIAQNDTDVVGHLKLIPKMPNIWRGQTTPIIESKTYVKTFEVSIYRPEVLFPSMLPKCFFGLHCMLAFKCSWPDVAEHWPHRFRKSGFPEKRTIQNAVKSGCHVISLTSDTRISDILDDPVHFMTSVGDHTWCYSFAAAEKEICRSLSSEQRQSFHVFKALVDLTLKYIPFPPSVVKSVFFHACEKIEKQSWKEIPGECLFILLKKIVKCLQNRHVPHYFMPGKNLLNFVPEETIIECYERLDGARLQPVVTLYFLLDQLNVMPSEVGCFVEDIVENIQLDILTRNEATLAYQSLLPRRTELLQEMIFQEHYLAAMLVFQDIVEEKGKLLEKLDDVGLLKTVTLGSHIGIAWCFALYLDINQRTTLTRKVCEGYGTIHVTEVFGPDCIEKLPDTLVPECFSISNGDLTFATRVKEVLLQAVSETTLIQCMKYYLKRYGELAGDSLVLPDRYSSAEVANSYVRGRQNQITQAMSGLNTLQKLYFDLYNICDRAARVEDFREMMPVYALIAESIGTPTALATIQSIWKRLDESENVKEVQRGMAMGFRAFSSLFGSKNYQQE